MKYYVGDRVRIKDTDIEGTIESIIRGQLIVNFKGSKIPTWPEDVNLIKSVEEETKPEPKFKVGDSVKVLKSGNTYTISQMMFNGREYVYELSNNGNIARWFSEDEMIEGLVEEESLTPPLKHPEDSTLAMLFHKTLILPEGYQFKDENGNIINATKIVLEKKKKEYPKTYEECVMLLGLGVLNELKRYDLSYIYKKDLIVSYQKLLICRDAYWKIAGEEMGLGKPWEPDWNDDNLKPCIGTASNEIIKCTSYSDNAILTFPTEEMRDAFYENFKNEIEICKELL